MVSRQSRSQKATSRMVQLEASCSSEHVAKEGALIDVSFPWLSFQGFSNFLVLSININDIIPGLVI